MQVLAPSQTVHRSADKSWKSRIRPALAGWVLGLLGGVVATRMNLSLPEQIMPPGAMILFMGLAGFALGFLRLQAVPWAVAGGVSVLFTLIGYSPFINVQVRNFVRSDPPVHCPAVVMLSADVWADGTLSGSAQDRLLKTLEVLKAGYAPNLIITRVEPPRPSGMGQVKSRLKLADLNVPVYEVGPTHDTHDEAVLVSALAKQHGWKEILLVTSPLHTRRAGATFEKTGLRVHVQPASETLYDLHELSGPGDRIYAFRDWFKEVIGWRVYKRRGWIR